MRHNTRHSKAQQLLIHRAQLLRANPSWPEQVLWNAIRSGKLGVPFRRQVPLGAYIANFVAPRAKLIVEVDGSCHRFKRSADARRDRKLARLGYKVLRQRSSARSRVDIAVQPGYPNAPPPGLAAACGTEPLSVFQWRHWRGSPN